MLKNEKGSGLPAVFIIITVLSGLLTTNNIDEANAFNLESEDYISLAQNDLKIYMLDLTSQEFANLGWSGDSDIINEIENTYDGIQITLIQIFDNDSRLYDFTYTDESARTNSREFFVSINTDPQGIENLGDFLETTIDNIIADIGEDKVEIIGENIESVDVQPGNGRGKQRFEDNIIIEGNTTIGYPQSGTEIRLDDVFIYIDGTVTILDVKEMEGTRFDDGFSIIYVTGDLIIDSKFDIDIDDTLIIVLGEVFLDFSKKDRELDGDNFSIISLTPIDNIDRDDLDEDVYKKLGEDFLYIGDNRFTSLSDIFENYGITIEANSYNFFDN